MQAPTAGTAFFVPPLPPPELDFGAWLAERTPPGAETVAVMPPGARAPLHLPRVRPAVPSPASFFSRRRRGSAPAVHAAYLADVHGLSPRALAASGQFAFWTERGARQHVRDGRLTAADLGAWPWAVVDGKALPRNWWADDAFALSLGEWAIAGQPVTVVRAGQRPSRRYTAAVRLPIA
jgi:hypothetical protein